MENNEIIKCDERDMINCREPLSRVLDIYCGSDEWKKGRPLDEVDISYLMNTLKHLIMLMNNLITEEEYKRLESRK